MTTSAAPSASRLAIIAAHQERRELMAEFIITAQNFLELIAGGAGWPGVWPK